MVLTSMHFATSQKQHADLVSMLRRDWFRRISDTVAFAACWTASAPIPCVAHSLRARSKARKSDCHAGSSRRRKHEGVADLAGLACHMQEQTQAPGREHDSGNSVGTWT